MTETQLLEVESLFLSCSAKLMRYLSLHTACREDAEDLLQDIFSNCCRYWDRYDPQRVSEQAWLFVIARNRLKNYYRARRPIDSLEQLEESSRMEISDDISGEAVRLLESRELLANALSELPARSREAIVLQYFGGRSTDEIAKLLQVSPANIRVILSRAKKQMAAFLKNHGWEEG